MLPEELAAAGCYQKNVSHQEVLPEERAAAGCYQKNVSQQDITRRTCRSRICYQKNVLHKEDCVTQAAFCRLLLSVSGGL
jgi:hypothetical protein